MLIDQGGSRMFTAAYRIHRHWSRAVVWGGILCLGGIGRPVAAWNVPNGYGIRADLTREPGEIYHRYPHVYIFEHAIELLEKEGCDNWAAIARAHLQDLADGCRYADEWLGRGRFILRLEILFGLKSIDLYTHTYSLAAQDHYYNPDREGTGREGLDQTDRKVLSQAVDYAARWLGTGLIAGDLFLFSIDIDAEPDVCSQFQSAAHYCQQYYDLALLKYRHKTPAIGRGYLSNALFYVGWASHLVQDMGVVNHTFDSHFSNHGEFEDFADGKGGESRYHALRGVAMYPFTPGADHPAAAEFVKAVARITHRQEYFDIVKDGVREKWDDLLTLGLSEAERHTAGLIALFMEEAGIPPQAPPLLGRVSAYDGTVLPGVQILYRAENEDQWSVLQAGRAGYFTLPVQPSTRLFLRPVLPGYHFRYYRFGTNLPGTRPFPIPYYQSAGVTEAETLDLVLEPDPGPVVQMLNLQGLPRAKQDSALWVAPEHLKRAETGQPIADLPGGRWLDLPRIGGVLPTSKTDLDNTLAWHIRRATLEATPDTGILQVPHAGLGLPESAWVRVQVNQLLDLATAQEVASLPDLLHCIDTARTHVAENARRLQTIAHQPPPAGPTGSLVSLPFVQAWQQIKSHLPTTPVPGPDGKTQTAVVLSENDGCSIANRLLNNGLAVVPSLHACAVEVQGVEGYGYLGRGMAPLELNTDARGSVSFLVRPGNRPGKLRVIVRAKHPSLDFLQPEAAVEFMVYPSLVGEDESPIQPPTLLPAPQLQMLEGPVEVLPADRPASMVHAQVRLDNQAIARLTRGAAVSLGLPMGVATGTGPPPGGVEHAPPGALADL